MPPPDIAFLSAVVPGTGPIEVQRLRTGLVNETYRVARAGLAYAVRLAGAGEVAVAPGLDRAFEAQVLKTAATAHLAPRPIYIDTQRGVLVSAWLEGRSLSGSEVRSADCMLRVAALTRAVHALPIPAAPRNMAPHDWIECYRASCDDSEGVLHTAAATWLSTLQAMPPVRRVLCHSDLHALNVLDQDRTLRLLDWEYAHVSEPLWDVAGWCANNDYTAPLRADFLRLYLGRPADAVEATRLVALTWLYDYTCLLWCQVWMRQLREAPAAEVLARAELLHARLHGTLPAISNGEFDGANDGD